MRLYRSTQIWSHDVTALTTLPLVLMTKVNKAMVVCVCECTQEKWTGIGRGGLVSNSIETFR